MKTSISGTAPTAKKGRLKDRLLTPQEYHSPYSAQLVLFPGLDGRRCQACDRLISNINLGGSEKGSAFDGRLWCSTCADLPRISKNTLAQKRVKRPGCRNQKNQKQN